MDEPFSGFKRVNGFVLPRTECAQHEVRDLPEGLNGLVVSEANLLNEWRLPYGELVITINQ